MPQPETGTVHSADELLTYYRRSARALRRCLDLADLRAERGNWRGAAEYVVGILDDLAPELEALSRALRSER